MRSFSCIILIYILLSGFTTHVTKHSMIDNLSIECEAHWPLTHQHWTNNQSLHANLSVSFCK